VVPEGLAIGSIPADFRERTIGPALPRLELLPRFEQLVAAIGGSLRGPGYERRPGDGSNNWVVSGALSATGMPLLANDPHRSLQLPSLRYLVHLVAPGWNVIGSGEPALPGVAIGHNERIAWGLTIVGIDQGDIFVERLNPEDPGQVWHGDGWEDLRSVTETLAVDGQADRVLTLEFSHHGPILYKDVDENLAYALRTVLSEPGTAGYLGSLRLDQAANWNEYLEGVVGWKVPSENLVYADVDGNIGWVAAGLTPLRRGWSGRLPVPAWTGAEWQGFRPLAELPQEYNPERGFITTANQNIMPAGYEPPLGYRWASPYRYERLVEVLSSGGPFTVADFKRLQFDLLSRPALRQIDRLRELVFDGPRIERARGLLVAWDGVMDTDSGAAALYKAWQAALEELDPAGVATHEPLARTRAEALTIAVERLEREQGGDWTAWRWGTGRELVFEHPLLDVFDAASATFSTCPTGMLRWPPTHRASRDSR
jgi:penicillin amidase